MSEKVNYIYLDDEPPQNVRGFAASVNSEHLHIEHEHPKPYLDQLLELKQWHNEGRFDGLILDLRLDNFYDSNSPGSDKANYRAATIAQEIRTRATEGEISDYPIVLWSTDERLQESYDRDNTGHDLFDLKTVKRELGDENAANIISIKLQSLVEGYCLLKERIGSNRELYTFLGFQDHPDFLDERVLISLDSTRGHLPVHEYARFILRQLLETSGPLINRYVLAARLGIDLNTSEDFDQLTRMIFTGALYKGAFNAGWPCWWSALVDNIWRDLDSHPKPLRGISAVERVELLQSITGLRKLYPAHPLLGAKDSSYWTICLATLRPLDPRDGFLIERQPIYPWQDRQYVSLEAIVEGDAARKRIRVDYLEQDRLERAKKILKGE